MPTKHRRHAITETPPVKEALDDLRAELGNARLQLSELVILGAKEKLDRLRSEDKGKAELRRRLANRIRNREPLGDPELADEAKRSWTSG